MPKDNSRNLIERQLASQNSKLEANIVFPTDPKSSYLSSYYRQSFVFPFNPDPLSGGNNYNIYDEMRVDDQVKAAISMKKNIVLSTGWQINCEDPKAKEFLETNLKERLNENFEDGMFDILSAYDYGFSLTEAIFRRNKNGLIELKELKTRPPHTFEFNLDNKGDLDSITQNQASGTRDFPPGYFLHQIYQPEFGNPFGISDLQAAYQAWKTKKFVTRFWGIYLERFASSTIIAKYGADESDQTKIDKLQEIVNKIQNSTAITIPEDMDIEFKTASQDSSETYIKSISMLNTMIARAILMPDLMGMSGSQTKGGSFALGETQYGMFLGMIKREQQALARNITLKVVKPLAIANFGDESCTFEFKPFTKDNSVEFMKLWTDAVRSKAWKPNPEEVNHMREMLKFPTGDVEEAPKPENPFDKNRDDEKDDDEKEEKKEMSHKCDHELLTFRELTDFEKKVDFNRVKSKLDSADKRVEPKLRSAARDIYLDFIKQVQRKNILNKFKPEAINELKVRFQKPMNMEFKRHMMDLYIDSYNTAQKEMFPSRKDIKRFVNTKELLPEEFMKVIDAESFKLVGDYSTNITNKLRNLVTEGIKVGVGERELIRQLKSEGLEQTDKWLKTVVRTKTNEMFNRARKSFYDNDPEAQEIVAAFEFSAIIDDRTTDVCRSLDGKIFEKDSPIIESVTPPLHFNCRSILVPVTKFEAFKDADEFVPKGKEPSVDSLKEMGGGLILNEKAERKDFLLDEQNIFTSGVAVGFGDNEIIPSPGQGKSLRILAIDISNMSDLHNSVVGVHSDEADEVKFRKTLNPHAFDLLDFKEEPWLLGEDNALLLNLTTDNAPTEYTVEYQIVDMQMNRIA